MCLAVPGLIVELAEPMALVDLGGTKRRVSLLFVPEAQPGDWILFHSGFATEIISADHARATRKLIEETAGPDRASRPATITSDHPGEPKG